MCCGDSGSKKLVITKLDNLLMLSAIKGIVNCGVYILVLILPSIACCSTLLALRLAT